MATIKFASKKIQKFLSSLSKTQLKKVRQVIDMLTDKGNLLKMPYSEFLREGLLCLRVFSGKQWIRLIYFFTPSGDIIIAAGFFKKSDETPDNEIRNALRFKSIYT